MLRPFELISTKTRPFLLTLLACFLMGCHANSAKPQASSSKSPAAHLDITVPKFPRQTFAITDYGAVGDGKTLNTQAFAKAIDVCVQAGGGHVLVPAGLWLTGPIRLKSHLDLHFEEGAVILFSPDFNDYPLVRKTYEGSLHVRCVSPLNGVELENVAITGSGVIDGAGQAWRPVKKSKMTESHWEQLVDSGGVLNAKGDVWWPNEAALKGPALRRALESRNAPLEDYAPIRAFLRPVMVYLVKCKNVLLDGPTFQNSPAWNIHPVLCENLTVRNINVRNPWFAQNGDGIDIDSCRHVALTHCRFDVGDDAICLKSGKGEYGRRRGVPSKDIVITDCTVYHGHGGVTIGSEMSGGVRNVTVNNCTFLGTDVGLRFKSTRGRGGVVEHITIENVRMVDVKGDAIRFNMFYGGRAPSPEDEPEVMPVTDGIPRFRKIMIKNLICRGAGSAMALRGLPEMPLQDVTLENVRISADQGVTCIDADHLIFKNVTIDPVKGHAFWFCNSRNVRLDDVKTDTPDGQAVKLSGRNTRAILYNGKTLQ